MTPEGGRGELKNNFLISQPENLVLTIIGT